MTGAAGGFGPGARAVPRHDGVELDRLSGLVRRTVDAVGAELDGMRVMLLGEIRALGQTIAITRREVARLRADRGDERLTPIPDATDELDAIVAHTAGATETILEAAEALDDAAARMAPDEAATVGAQTVRIFEACSFQDITGQRISKVVAALQQIEARLARIAISFEDGVDCSDELPLELTRPVDPLLNGPQPAHAAMDQDAIDKLLTF